MKKLFFIVTLFLSMMFAPFIFAANIIQNAPTIPGYQSPVFESATPILAAHCRDVLKSIQKDVVISKLTQRKSRSIMLENALATFGKDETNFNYWGAVNRNGVGKVYSPMTANNKKKYIVLAG